MSYKPDEIGKLLKDLESKHSSILMQDVGILAKKALGAATKDVSSIAKSISKAATTDLSDLMKKSTVKYYLEFIKVDDSSSGDLWNFYIYSADDRGGTFHRFGRTTERIIIEKKDPELLKLKQKKKRLQALNLRKYQGSSKTILQQLDEVEKTLTGNRVRLKEIRRPDFERLFKTKNPLSEFREDDFIRIKRYLDTVKKMPGIKKPWIEIVETEVEGNLQYHLDVYELHGSQLKFAHKYPISHMRHKEDYNVVYCISGSKSTALFRVFADGKRCAINDNIIPPAVNTELLKREDNEVPA
jgi:hypothetical protein